MVNVDDKPNIDGETFFFFKDWMNNKIFEEVKCNGCHMQNIHELTMSKDLFC